MSTEDRSILPDGLMVQHKGWHTEHRPACYVVVDTRETSEAEVTEDAWAFVDRIRAEERERVAALLETKDPEALGLEREMSISGAAEYPIEYDGIAADLVAAWLRSGAKGEL